MSVLSTCCATTFGCAEGRLEPIEDSLDKAYESLLLVSIGVSSTFVTEMEQISDFCQHCTGYVAAHVIHSNQLQ